MANTVVEGTVDKILYALLALCAIIIVFATAVTLVQALYFKLIQTRRDGMMTLLRSVYRDAVDPRLKQAGLRDPKVFDGKHRHRFALDMTVNRAFPETGIRKVLSDQPILRRYWGARVESMSTRQFAEHLAGTHVGETIATLPPEQLKSMLREFAYEFERMGELQIRTFKTKVGVQTVVIGILLAFLFNVDMLRTFKALSADTDLAQQVSTLMLDGVQQQSIVNVSAAARQSIEDAGNVVTPDAPAPQPQLEQQPETLPAPVTVADTAAVQQAQAAETRALTNQAAADAIAKVLAKAKADSAMFGLPIGYAGYPYCQPVGTDPAAPATPVFADDRCAEDKGGEVDAMAVATGAFQSLFGPGKSPEAVKTAKANAGHLSTFTGRLFHKSGSGVVWFFSVVFAGACFGLGAPFWFDVFTRLSSFASTRGIAQLTPPRKLADGAESATLQPPPPTAIRAKTCVTPEELLDAFVVSARSNGVSGAWSLPVAMA